MKRIRLYSILLAGLAAFTFVSCEKDLYDPEAAKAEVNKNVQNVFGVQFSENQDWSSTVSGEITITTNADIDNLVKLQILTCSPFGSADGNGATVLNEIPVTKGQTVTLNYDAPSYRERLYAACVYADNTYYIKGFKPGQESVSFATSTKAKAKAKVTRALPAAPTINRSERSFNNLRTEQSDKAAFALWKNSGWENDILYQMADVDEDPQLIFPQDYSEDERADIRDIINSFLQNRKVINGVRYNDNREKIVTSDFMMLEGNYMETTGDAEITFAPIYYNAGTEISGCHIYYYYYKPEQIAGKSEAEVVQFLKDLPKYKAIQVSRATRTSKPKYFQDMAYYPHLLKDSIMRVQQYTLIYWGDGTPEIGRTTGEYLFPAGYRIGVMMRSGIETNGTVTKAGNENSVIAGCLYSDGRLNTEVNQYGNLKNANLENNDPRVAIFGANNMTYLCFEDGTDQDFNDLIIEVDGGIKRVPQRFELAKNVYTFCYEDRNLGDYDMNDIIIKAQRIDRTHVKYSIEACGANDELYIKNINGEILNENTEIHEYFHAASNQFVNVEKDGFSANPVQEIVEVDPMFSFTNASTRPYIFNKSTGANIHIAEKGEDPHAIMLPCDFKYPLEHICIKDAYPLFNNWGQNEITDTDWFTYPELDKVYPNSVFK